MQVPEALYEDMIAGPKRAYDQAVADLNARQMTRLFAGLFGMDAPATGDGDLKAAEAEVKDFRAPAAMAMTPQQLERLARDKAPAPAPARKR